MGQQNCGCGPCDKETTSIFFERYPINWVQEFDALEEPLAKVQEPKLFKICCWMLLVCEKLIYIYIYVYQRN